MKKILYMTLVIVFMMIIVVMPLVGCKENYNDYYYKSSGDVYLDSDEIFAKGCGSMAMSATDE